MGERAKKAFSWLREFDFFWSLPIALLSFIFFPIIGQKIWGEALATYSPEFIHAIIYTALVVITFNSMTQMGIYINFPKLYDFYLNKGFNELSIWQRCVIFLFVYVFYYCSLVVVWLTLV